MVKTSTGLEENVASMLCYVLFWVSGLVFFLIEKENKTVRFHAMQSIVTFGALHLAVAVLSQIPFFIGLVIAWIGWVFVVILMIVLAYRAFMGQRYKLRWAGDVAEKWLDSETG
jgi:uncharacterized membrane protein